MPLKAVLLDRPRENLEIIEVCRVLFNLFYPSIYPTNQPIHEHDNDNDNEKMHMLFTQQMEQN